MPIFKQESEVKLFGMTVSELEAYARSKIELPPENLMIFTNA